jgi:sensor histidine kinase YesM
MTSLNKIVRPTYLRPLQHLTFWVLSYYIFLQFFKIGNYVEKIDYIYTALFHITIIPPIYINLELLIPKIIKGFSRWLYILIIAILILLFALLNYSFFDKWSNLILPDYYFISYYSFGEICLFFIVYIGLTSLLKLSKSWFIVNRLQKDLLVADKKKVELELTALRAQMNPHFIFNCMNSIKSLIQQKKEEKATEYLTTFSKLLRTILQNSDQKEISLYDEIETCRLYIQLENLRFGNKLKYLFTVDPEIDLKSYRVPALLIQPFVENAIWHGIMPKETGGTVSVHVYKNGNTINCAIDDDGIGRKISELNKFKGENVSHSSKGLHLTQSRLALDNALNDRKASVEIIDKTETGNRSIGTSVILTFNEF